MPEKTPTDGWTPETIRNLGMTTDLTTAAHIIGIGRTLAFDLAKHDRFPVRILRVGGRVLVPTAGLIALLTSSSPSETSVPKKDTGTT